MTTEIDPQTTATPDALDLDAVEARAIAATDGPWFYDSYSGVFSAPKVALYDPWLDTVDASHTMERHGRCDACGQDGCRLFSDEYRRNPLVAHVPAHHGDTAIGARAADAKFIAAARTDVPKMAAEIRWLRAEWDRLVKERAAMLAVVRAAEEWADAIVAPVEPLPESEALYRAVQSLPNTQEPCDTCSSTGSGCPECRNDGPTTPNVL